MSVSILTTADRQQYADFVRQHPLGTIHQTWEWGIFQEKDPDIDRTWMLADMESDNYGCGQIKASALVLRRRLPFNLCWLYVPRGPLFDEKNPETMKPLLAKIREIGRQHRAVFVRFDPPIVQIPHQHIQKFLAEMGAHEAHQQYHPQDTLVLDLTTSPDQLLKDMKSKGRYNIKVAQKHNVKIRISEPSQLSRDSEVFYQLLTQTTGRDGFSGHPRRFYEEMLTTLGPEHSKLYLAEYEGKPVAAIITTYFKDTATYYFGASSNEFRHTMAPYLLQWQAILDAQKAGYKKYDFLGIAPEGEPGHHLAGVSDFKLKFGGERVTYLAAQEIVYRPVWYLALKTAKYFRRFRH